MTKFDSLPITRRNAIVGTAATLSIFGAESPAWAQKRRSFTYVRATALDNLDPHQVLDVGRMGIRLNAYDAPIRYVDNPARMEMWLAESIDVSADALTYTMKLRPNIKFQDGSVLTSEDVVYSIERILALKKGAYGYFKDAVQPGTTTAIDPLTVQFRLSVPYAIFIPVMCELWIVNSKVVRKNEANGDWGSAWMTRNTAGSGGYRIARHSPTIGIQFERFPDHFMGWKEGCIDVAEFKTVVEASSRVLGIQRGDFDSTDNYLPTEQIARLRESGRVNIMEDSSLRTFFFVFNCSKAPFDDANFRRALSYAFDYEGFIKNVLENSVTRNAGIIPNPQWGAPADLKGYTYDLDKARHHLSLVKQPLRSIQIGVLAGFPHSEQAGQLMQAGCTALGLECRVVAEPAAVISSRGSDPNRAHDLIATWQSAYFADPQNWAGYLYYGKNMGAGNKSFYKNDRVDELLEKALIEVKQEVRKPLYEEVSRILVEDAAGIFIYNTTYIAPISKRVRATRFCPIGEIMDLRWMVVE